jgi:F-box protein 21
MTRRLNLLPDEILHSILIHCHPYDTAAISQSSRRLNTVAENPLLWRQYCQQLFKFWDERHEIEKKLDAPTSVVDWKGLYLIRHTLDLNITRILNQTLGQQSGRIGRIESIVRNGYDAKDTLIRHNSVGEGTEDYLARRSVCSKLYHLTWIPILITLLLKILVLLHPQLPSERHGNQGME